MIYVYGGDRCRSCWESELKKTRRKAEMKVKVLQDSMPGPGEGEGEEAGGGILQ